MEIDAYVLGVDEPLDEFKGAVIAVIHRRNDVENKHIVVAADAHLSDEAIWSAVEFQEKYFDAHILR